MNAVPDSIRSVNEETLLRICGVARSTRQNWVRHSLLDEPLAGRYRERHVVETGVVTLLVRALKRLDDVRRVREAHLETLLAAIESLGPADYLVAALEPRLLRVVVARSEAELGRAIVPYEPTLAIPLMPDLADVRSAFWRFATSTGGESDNRRRGSSSRTQRPAQSS